MTATSQAFSPNSHPHLRALNVRSDLPQVADLIELCFAERLDNDGRRYVRQMRASARSRTGAGVITHLGQPLSGYIWEENGRVVGNLNLLPSLALGRRIYLIANVAVHPDYRRRGIAQALTEAALEHIRQAGVRSAWLQADDDNEIAQALYRGLGFQERYRRTAWHLTRAFNDPLPDDTEGIIVRPRPSRDWRDQRRWLERLYPQALSWHMPLNRGLLAGGLFGMLNRALNERRVLQWSAYEDERLIGVLSWQASHLQADWLWLAAPHRGVDLALRALVPAARRHSPAGRKLSLDLPVDEAVETVQALGFQKHITLVWMNLEL